MKRSSVMLLKKSWGFGKRWLNLLRRIHVQVYYWNSKIVCEPFPKFLAYVETTVLNTVKKKFVRAWTNKILHLGCRNTNIVESAHGKLKKYLRSRVGDLVSCWDLGWNRQNVASYVTPIIARVFLVSNYSTIYFISFVFILILVIPLYFVKWNMSEDAHVPVEAHVRPESVRKEIKVFLTPIDKLDELKTQLNRYIFMSDPLKCNIY